MGSARNDELIAETLAMLNVVRGAYGKDPLSELPDAVTGNASDCLFYRALADVGVRGVSGDMMTFTTDRVASLVGELWGTEANGPSVRAPKQFSEVVGLFDSHQLPHYETGRN